MNNAGGRGPPLSSPCGAKARTSQSEPAPRLDQTGSHWAVASHAMARITTATNARFEVIIASTGNPPEKRGGAVAPPAPRCHSSYRQVVNCCPSPDSVDTPAMNTPTGVTTIARPSCLMPQGPSPAADASQPCDRPDLAEAARDEESRASGAGAILVIQPRPHRLALLRRGAALGAGGRNEREHPEHWPHVGLLQGEHRTPSLLKSAAALLLNAPACLPRLPNRAGARRPPRSRAATDSAPTRVGGLSGRMRPPEWGGSRFRRRFARAPGPRGAQTRAPPLPQPINDGP
jgi:hypothetical protein